MLCFLLVEIPGLVLTVFIVFVELIHLLGVPVELKVSEFVVVLIFVIAIHISISAGLIYCERLTLDSKITQLKVSPKISLREYERMVKYNTNKEVKKLKESEEYLKYLEHKKTYKPEPEIKVEQSDSDSESGSERVMTSHELATYYRLL